MGREPRCYDFSLVYVDAAIYKPSPHLHDLLVDEHIAFLVRLRELAPKWKAVGDQLGVPVSELDAIQENHRGSLDMCGSCLRAMFLWWLRNGDATSRKLARAVHEVGERSAEEKICREFGKLDVWNSCSYIPGGLCVQRRHSAH